MTVHFWVWLLFVIWLLFGGYYGRSEPRTSVWWGYGVVFTLLIFAICWSTAGPIWSVLVKG